MRMLKNQLPHNVFFNRLSVAQRQMVLFLFVGGINTAFSYLCYVLFIYLGLYYVLAVALSTSLGVLFNFLTTGRIVFKNMKHSLIFKFIGVYGFLYGINILLLKLLHLFSSNYYLTGFITIFPLAVMSFVLNKYFVFSERHEIN